MSDRVHASGRPVHEANPLAVQPRRHQPVGLSQPRPGAAGGGGVLLPAEGQTKATETFAVVVSLRSHHVQQLLGLLR